MTTQSPGFLARHAQAWRDQSATCRFPRPGKPSRKVDDMSTEKQHTPRLYFYSIQIAPDRAAVVCEESSDGPTIAARLLCECALSTNADEIAAKLSALPALVEAAEQAERLLVARNLTKPILRSRKWSHAETETLDALRAALAKMKGGAA